MTLLESPVGTLCTSIIALEWQANILAKTLGMDEISVDDIDSVSELFMDAKSSARVLHDQEDEYLYWSA